jgi:hypothetical protein
MSAAAEKSWRKVPGPVTSTPDANGNGDRLLLYRVDQLEAAVGEIRDAVKSIDKSLQTFATIGTQSNETRAAVQRALSAVDALERRIQAVEIELPTLKLVRNWVIGGVLSVAGSVGAAALALVLR